MPVAPLSWLRIIIINKEHIRQAEFCLVVYTKKAFWRRWWAIEKEDPKKRRLDNTRRYQIWIRSREQREQQGVVGVIGGESKIFEIQTLPEVSNCALCKITLARQCVRGALSLYQMRRSILFFVSLFALPCMCESRSLLIYSSAAF